MLPKHRVQYNSTVPKDTSQLTLDMRTRECSGTYLRIQLRCTTHTVDVNPCRLAITYSADIELAARTAESVFVVDLTEHKHPWSRIP